MKLRQIPFSAWLGLTGLAVILFAAVFAPVLVSHNPYEVLGGPWEPASKTFLLGTDNLGRDLLSRLLYGSRTTLFVASAATVVAFAIGVTLAFIAAISGGVTDQLLSRGNDLLMSVPGLIVSLIVLAVLPQNIWILILVIALVEATRVYRVSYAIASNIRVMEFVEAAWIRGENRLWIVFHEILPNAMAALLSEFGLRFAYSILFVSALSFLGLGVQPPTADWGGMVRDNKDGIIFGATAALIPGFAIAILVICVNLVVDWLVDRSAHITGEDRNV